MIGRLRSQLIPYEVFYAAGGGEVKMATDLDALAGTAFGNLLNLLEIWNRGTNASTKRASRVIDDLVTVFNLIRRAPLSKKNDESVRQFVKTLDARSCRDAASRFARYDGIKLTGKTHEHLSKVAAGFLGSAKAWEAVMHIAADFDGLRFDYEKAEDDVWYTDPPLKQLADMAREEQLDADDLIGRLEAARDQVKHFQGFEDEAADANPDDQTLQLMTATRAKAKSSTRSSCLTPVKTCGPTNKPKRKPKSKRNADSSTSPSPAHVSASSCSLLNTLRLAALSASLALMSAL